MKWKGRVVFAVTRSLVNRHHVGHRHPPEVVVADRHIPDEPRQLPPLVVGEIDDRGDLTAGENQHLVGIPGEPRHARDEALVLGHRPASGHFAGKHVLSEKPSGVGEVPATALDLAGSVGVDQAARIDLAMRMRVGRADERALVFEDQHMGDLGTGGECRRSLRP